MATYLFRWRVLGESNWVSLALSPTLGSSSSKEPGISITPSCFLSKQVWDVRNPWDIKGETSHQKNPKLATNHDYLRVSVSSTPTAQWSSLWNPKVFLRPSCWRRLPSARHFSRSFACWDLSPKGSNIYSSTLLFEYLKSGQTVEVWCSSHKFLGVDMRFVEENRQTNIAWMILMTGETSLFWC